MDDDSGYYRIDSGSFKLYTSHRLPSWRPPQFGALGAVVAHWSLRRPAPALVSLPTGTGKTAVAVALAHLAHPRRVLVVVPSTELRSQIGAAFSSEDVLISIGALTRNTEPVVMQVTGRVSRWEELEQADVVVAIPNSISPTHYVHNPPPSSLFDLVIVDEAHHAPAPTWRAIIDHFQSARVVLLTATPKRRDGQRLPGDHVYHYPLRQALDEGVFKTVQARILEVPFEFSRTELDQLIADEVARVLSATEHSTSAVLIRAANRQRAFALANLYEQRNIQVQVLHSGLGRSKQKAIIDGLRSGQYRAVAVVGMLIEGFDLPRLRVVAYHDKFKSIPATVQLIGRLARVDAQFSQPSVLVTVRDIDVYPELHGAVRQLYEEDADWASVLPGVIDDDIAEAIADREYARTFTSPPPLLSVEAVHPIRRSVIHEVPGGCDGLQTFAGVVLPVELENGRLLRGCSILYSALNRDANTLLIVTAGIHRPRWHDHPGLDSPTYDLHIVSYRQPPQAQMPGLLFLNTSNYGIGREVLQLLGLEEGIRSTNPAILQAAFDSLDRISVSSVGVRNTYSSRGIPSYKTFAGSGVDRGIREVDTAFGSLGHAMIQLSDADGTFTAGVSTAKGKYWETRYASLRAYEEWLTNLAERYWFPPASPIGQLLPQISRGKRLDSWPSVQPLTAEFDYALNGAGWNASKVGPLDSLELRAYPAGSDGKPDQLPIELVNVQEQESDQSVVWRGHQDLTGNINADSDDLTVQRGFGGVLPLADLLSARPPTIFFMDGTTVHGATIYDSRPGIRPLRTGLLQERLWTGVDIQAETRSKALERGQGRSVHEALEEYLVAQPPREKHRWILFNDGSGELADYLVLEVGRNRVILDLWHAKAAGGHAPSVRVGDMQVVVAQAIKSRRWITDVGLWTEIGARLNDRSSPALKVVEGSARLLNALCGENNRRQRLSFRRIRPIITGTVGIVQPGLSRQTLYNELNRSDLSAVQIRDLLTVFHDSVSAVAAVAVICST